MCVCVFVCEYWYTYRVKVIVTHERVREDGAYYTISRARANMHKEVTARLIPDDNRAFNIIMTYHMYVCDRV